MQFIDRIILTRERQRTVFKLTMYVILDNVHTKYISEVRHISTLKKNLLKDLSSNLALDINKKHFNYKLLIF